MMYKKDNFPYQIKVGCPVYFLLGHLSLCYIDELIIVTIPVRNNEKLAKKWLLVETKCGDVFSPNYYKFHSQR